MPHLPDPRFYGAPSPGNEVAPLVALSEKGDAEARVKLRAWLARCLSEGDDDRIAQALRESPSPTAYHTLWEEVCFAVDHPVENESGTIEASPFALPIVVIAAATRPAVISGVLRDIGEIRALLEAHGAAGVTRNFGITNALCALESLERLKPGVVHRWRRDWSETRDIPPADIVVAPGREQVELRFLLGAGITPRNAASFLETASNIGAWAMPVAGALARQLAQPGLDALAMPRPPVSLLKAAYAGRFAQLETAFNLFSSNVVRRVRAAVGDPVVAVSAHRLEGGAGEVRVSIGSPFDETLLEGFRWPLHPLDDLERILALINELMQDCRVSDVRVVDSVLPDRLESGALFLRAADAERLSALRH